MLARDSNYFNRDWLRLAPAEPQSQHAQGQQTPSNPRARKNQSSRNQSGGKRKYQHNDSSDDERDSIWSQSASEQGYSSNQPSSSHRKKERKQKPPRFDAHRAQLTQEADTRRESLYAAWAAADEHQSDKLGKDVRPRQYPNFSNTPPPTFTPSEATAKEALYADRARARAEEEATIRIATEKRSVEHGPPRPPVTPIPAIKSTLKPSAPFVMPATPTLLTAQPLTQSTSDTRMSEATKLALSRSRTDASGLMTFPHPSEKRLSSPIRSDVPHADMREIFEEPQPLNSNMSLDHRSAKQ